jgi:hypothetical protein
VGARAGCAVAAAVAWLGCQPGAPVARDGDAPPRDAAHDAGSRSDAAVDAAPDAPDRVDLVALCGAVPSSFEEWEACYLRRWCEWQVACIPMSTYRDVTECVALANAVEGGRLAAERAGRARALAQLRAEIAPGAFAQCLADLDGDRCATAAGSVACATRYRGRVADGGSCAASEECAAPGAECRVTCAGSCCTGVCQPKRALGEACSGFYSCEPGLRCRQVCRSGDPGSPCADDRDCDSSAWCRSGSCAPDFATGSACSSPLQCGGDDDCVGLSVTDPAPGACSPVSGVGDRCDYFCYGNLYCDTTRRCRELPALGESCSSTPCRGVDTYCRAGRCARREGLGARCAGSYVCEPGLFCTSELGAASPVCAAPGALGQACAAARHCETYLCTGTSGQVGTCVASPGACALDES